MKKFTRFLFIGLMCLVCADVVFAEPKAMEAGSEELYQLQEQSLNSTYQRVLKAYADDPIFITKLRMSQRAWIKFRDAEMAALFPHAGKAGYYGSSLSAARRYWLSKLSEERTLQLSRWLQGAEVGEMFRGSIKIKPVE